MFTGRTITRAAAILGVSAAIGGCVAHKRSKPALSKPVYCTRTTKSNNAVKQEGIFSKKTIIITGAAGDIGSATAEEFASKGSSVVLVDLPSTEERLQDLSCRLADLGGGRVLVATGDVTSREDMEAMVRKTCAEFGRIDFFFNNAGIQGELRPLQETSGAVFKKVLDVNIYGVYLCLQLVGNAMIHSGQRGGVIVNTASLAGLQGPPNMAAYAASKFAVVGLTKTASKDLAPHGIRVCAVAPGLLEGRMWPTQVRGQAECRRRLQKLEGDVTEEEFLLQEKRMIDGVPLKRLGHPKEVASVVAFLCSEGASYLTGTVVPIEGGRYM